MRRKGIIGRPRKEHKPVVDWNPVFINDEDEREQYRVQLALLRRMANAMLLVLPRASAVEKPRVVPWIGRVVRYEHLRRGLDDPAPWLARKHASQ